MFPGSVLKQNDFHTEDLFKPLSLEAAFFSTNPEPCRKKTIELLSLLYPDEIDRLLSFASRTTETVQEVFGLGFASLFENL